MIPVRPAGHLEEPGPAIGAGLWRQVVSAAGLRCQCTSQCGRKHTASGGQCPAEDKPGEPLHAVPARPVGPIGAMQLTADGLIALCDLCHAGVLAVRRREERDAIDRRLARQEMLW